MKRNGVSCNGLVNLLNCVVNLVHMIYPPRCNHLALCYCFRILCYYVLDVEFMDTEAKICLKLDHPNIGMYIILFDFFFY